jgi:thiol-disulfide isomerase/thioredoxin
MSINKIEFTDLEKRISESGKSALHHLASDIGKVYVVSITRDGCPACKKQKPRIEKLAKNAAEKYGNKVIFTQVHVKYSPGEDKESRRSKDVFGHYFYPTNLILLRTADRGAIEYYRNVSPTMTELKTNIQTTFETATMIEKDAQEKR